jgi:hypothetical protein
MPAVTCLNQQLHFIASAEYFSISGKKHPEGCFSLIPDRLVQISRITGMIRGLRLVLFWMYRFRSLRIFSLMTP